jgi:hypothetical protein
MSKDTKEMLRSVTVALIVSLVLGAMSAYGSFLIVQERVSVVSIEVEKVKIAAEKERDIVREMAKDIAWIRGRLEGMPQ